MKRFPMLWAILFAALTAYIAQLGFLIVPILCAAAVAIIYTIKYGYLYFAVISAVSVVVLYLSSGFNIIYTICMACIWIPASLAIVICLKKKTDFAVLLTSSSLAETAVFTLGIRFWTQSVGKSYAEIISEDIMSTAKIAGISEQIYMGDDICAMIDMILPSALIITAVFTVYLMFALSRVILRKQGIEFMHLPLFNDFHINRGPAIVFLILFVISLIAGGYSPLLYNVIIIVTTLLMICGLSVINFYLSLFGVRIFGRTIIYFIMFTFLSPITTPLLFALGIWDSFSSSRRIFKH